MAVDPSTLQHLAKLARLDLSDLDGGRLLADLNRVLDLVDALGQAPAGACPAAPAPAASALRADLAAAPAEREHWLAGAPRTSLGYFLVPKVIE